MTTEIHCPRCGGPLEKELLSNGAGEGCPWCATQPVLAPTPGGTPGPGPGDSGDSWKSFGKYFLAEKIGTGGMGEVWKALDSELGRSVALKFLKTADEAELARFRREAQTAASLTHPNIASIYEVGEIRGRHYIAMQCVKGRTLGRFPKDDRKLLLRLVRDAARAVAYANHQGIIHRDLKPENLMASEGPGGWQIYVLDFGLARPIEKGQTVSQSGTVLGTPAYMSPEQTRGEVLDERTDVYSLGATLYELLTGRQVFLGQNAYEVARMVLTDEPLPPRRINPRIHQDLETIILKCLEKQRERRYASAGELADDLDRFLEGEPIQARPANTLYRLVRFCAKRRAAVITFAMLVALVVVGVMFALERSRTEAYQSALQKGRDAWEEVVKATTAVQMDRARSLASSALGHFDAATRSRATAEALVLRGRCLQILGRTDEARQAWEGALELDADNQEARYQSAKLLLLDYQKSRGTPQFQPYASASESEHPPQLIEDFRPESDRESRLRREAEALLSGYGGAREKGEFLRGLLAMGRGQFGDAADLLSQYTGIEPWDASAMRLEAISWYFAGRYDRAGQALDRLLAIGPDAQGFLWRGIVHLRRRNYEAAFADCTKAIQLDGTLAWAYRNRARAHRSRGDVDSALADLARSLELEPDSFMTYLDRVYLRNTYRGDYQGAREDADRAVELNPRAGFAWQSRASIRLVLNDLAGAVADATKALELDPRRDPALATLVAGRLGLGEPDGAWQAVMRAIEANPTSEAYRARSSIRDFRGDAKGAIEDLDKALQIDPNSDRAYLDRARVRRDRGDRVGASSDFDHALREIDEAYEKRPRDPRGYLRRALVREAVGDFAGAIEECTRAIELDPRHGPAYAARAAARVAFGDHDGAIRDSRMTLNPLHAVRGVARIGKGEYEAALVDLNRAVELSRGLSLLERALAQYGKGALKEALDDLRLAAGQAGRGPKEGGRLQLLMWVVRSRLGDRAEADQELAAWFKDRPAGPLMGWHRRVAEVLLGRAAEDTVLRLREEETGGEIAERACEAHYYAAMRRLIDGDLDRALELLRKSGETLCRKDLPESLAAAADLRALRAKK